MVMGNKDKIQGREQTHESFRAKAGTRSDVPAQITDPGHGGCRWDLLGRRGGLVAAAAFTVAGTAVHCLRRHHRSVQAAPGRKRLA
ncbi:hypothetical protein GW17_00010335 [Ensete ventricosum]|nr:hypothetical protein GW17_00010335 [Ensete ventricosum]RZS27742.1 hypothetical protein BHM03_00061266 [Ensete ventricosum]